MVKKFNMYFYFFGVIAFALAGAALGQSVTDLLLFNIFIMLFNLYLVIDSRNE